MTKRPMAPSSDTTRSQADTQRDESGTPAPLLALALECRRPHAGSIAWSLRDLDEVRIGRGEERTAIEESLTLHVQIPDDTMSSRHASLLRRDSRWWIRDAGSKNGTLLNGRRVDSAALEEGDFVELGTSFFVFRESDAGAWGSARRDLPPDAELPSLRTVSGRLRRDFIRLARVAQSEVPVMVLGETGTGKELVARAVHALSGRTGQFLAVNCAALSESVLESELFGHRKGAFSGASESRPGLVRAADGGTLFLDEIGELPPKSQAKLLRVLQEGEVHPLGETHPVRIDVRMVTATHRNLIAQIGSDGFRDDFYGRLAGYEMALLPLRARKEDIGLLVSVLLERIVGSKVDRMSFQPQAARALFVYDWPRNVRELELALAAAAALSDDGKIRYDYLPGLMRRSVSEPHPPLEEIKNLKATLAGLFEQHAGNLSAVAREMGKERVQIRRWCKRFDIDPTAFRKP